jgi:hypothetical protein
MIGTIFMFVAQFYAEIVSVVIILSWSMLGHSCSPHSHEDNAQTMVGCWATPLLASKSVAKPAMLECI